MISAFSGRWKDPQLQNRTLERELLADRRRRQHALPESIRQRRHGAPAGAMAGRDRLEAELGKARDRLRDASRVTLRSNA